MFYFDNMKKKPFFNIAPIFKNCELWLGQGKSTDLISGTEDSFDFLVLNALSFRLFYLGIIFSFCCLFDISNLEEIN